MDYDRNDSGLDEPWKDEESGIVGALEGIFNGANSGDTRRSGAQTIGRAAEEGASAEDEGQDARSAEDGGGGLYRAREGLYKAKRAKEGLDKAKETGKKLHKAAELAKEGGEAVATGGTSVVAKFAIKKIAPLALLVLVLVGIGILVGVSQFWAPFSYVANLKDIFNTQRTGFNISTNTLVDETLSGSAHTAAVNVGGEKVSFYEDPQLSDEMKENLENNRIYYVEFAGIRGLVYQLPIHKIWMLVTANSRNAEAYVGQTVELSNGRSVVIEKGMKLDDAYREERDFANDLDVALRSIKGHAAGWWDEEAKVYNSQIVNSRNKLVDYTQETPEFDKVEEAIKKNGDKVAIPGTNGVSSVELWIPVKCDDEDDSGDCHDEKMEGLGDDGLTQGMSEGEVQSRLTARAKKAMMADTINDSTDECKTSKAVAAVDAVGTAVLKIQLINSGTTFFESVDKAKSGDGGGVLNAYMKKLSERGPTMWLNDNAEWEVVEGKEERSALESQAWNQVAGDDDPVTADDPMAKTYNMDTLISDSYPYNEQLKGMGIVYSDGGVERCSSTTQYGGANNFYDTEGSGPSGGLFSWLASAIKELWEAIFRIYEGRAEKIASVAAKRTTEVMNLDIEEASGESKAYALLAAGNLVYGQKAIMVSGRTGTEEQLTAQWKQTQEVIAREAEVDRSHRSPFDATSQNTFLGSIVKSFSTTMAKVRAPLQSFSSFIGAATSSLKSVMPIVGAAADENNFRETLRSDCPTAKYLEPVTGGKMSGDAFCFQEAYQDPATFKKKPVEVYKQILQGVSGSYKGVDNFLGLNEDGNPIVNPKGEYATWLVSCSVKKSQWGYMSGQSSSFIQEQLKGGASSAANSAMTKGLEKNEINEIEGGTHNVVYDRSELDWATGLNCMGGRDGSLAERVSLYAQFNTYQNMLEVSGIFKKAAHVAFLEDYYREHPFYTNSVEGVIAEYSGLTEDEVELALGMVEYYDFIAHYEPENKGPLNPIPEEEPMYFESTTVIAEALPSAIVKLNENYGQRREVVATA